MCRRSPPAAVAAQAKGKLRVSNAGNILPIWEQLRPAIAEAYEVHFGITTPGRYMGKAKPNNIVIDPMRRLSKDWSMAEGLVGS